MPKTNIDQLREGMVVLADVKNMDDMLLLPEGFKLTEKHINLLRAWGVAEIDVETDQEMGNQANPVEQMDPELVAQITENMKQRFWQWDDGNLVQQEVFRLVLQRKLRTVSSDPPPHSP